MIHSLSKEVTASCAFTTGIWDSPGACSEGQQAKHLRWHTKLAAVRRRSNRRTITWICKAYTMSTEYVLYQEAHKYAYATLKQGFLTVCVSSLPVNSPHMRKVNFLLRFLAQLFRSCVLKLTVLESSPYDVSKGSHPTQIPLPGQ